MREWATTVEDTFYIIGSVVGPHPYPMITRNFQRVIGDETRSQLMKAEGKLPDYLVACIGGGRNAIGLFYPFIHDEDVKLISIEAGGGGMETENYAATNRKRKHIVVD